MSHFYATTFDGETAGRTFTASVVDADAVALGSQPTANIQDLGGGFYGYSTDEMPDGHEGYLLILDEDDATFTAIAIAPAETEAGGGALELDMAQAVPASPDPDSVGEAFRNMLSAVVVTIRVTGGALLGAVQRADWRLRLRLALRSEGHAAARMVARRRLREGGA